MAERGQFRGGHFSVGSIVKANKAHLFRQLHAFLGQTVHQADSKYVIVSTVATRIKNKEGKKPADPDPEFIATPEDRKHEGLAKIRINGTVVSFLYPKDNDFIDIMHRYFCKWRDAWTKKASSLVGTPEDIAADIGNALLREGFAVSFPTEGIKAKAVNADFEPVHTRWVVPYDSTDKKVAFEWEGRNEDLYYAVRGMKGCLYKNGTLHISVDRYNDIEDCARKNGFYIIPEAQALLDQAMRSSSRWNRGNRLMIPSAAKTFWRNSRKRTDMLYIESPGGFTINCDTELVIDTTIDIPEDLLDED